MSDNNPFDPEKILIVNLKLLKSQVDSSADFDLSKIESYALDNSLQLGFNLEDKLVRADFTIEIKTASNGENANEATGNFHLVYIFHIENLKELAKPDMNNLIELHPALSNALSSIAYSTSRGILLTRLQGTALCNFVLPVINPNKLLHTK